MLTLSALQQTFSLDDLIVSPVQFKVEMVFLHPRTLSFVNVLLDCSKRYESVNVTERSKEDVSRV